MDDGEVLATVAPMETGRKTALYRWDTNIFGGTAQSTSEAKVMVEKALGLNGKCTGRGRRPRMEDQCIYQPSTGKVGTLDDMERLSTERTQPQPFRRELRRTLWHWKNQLRLRVANPMRRFFRSLGRLIRGGRTGN